MEVKVFKMTNGEEFMAEVVSVSDDEAVVSVKHPVVLVMNAQGNHEFTPWIATTTQTDFDIDVVDVRFMENVVTELDGAYKQMFGAIVIPSSTILHG